MKRRGIAATESLRSLEERIGVSLAWLEAAKLDTQRPRADYDALSQIYWVLRDIRGERESGGRAQRCDEPAKPEAGPMQDVESLSGVQALGSSGLALIEKWQELKRINERARDENERAIGDDRGRRAMVELCDIAITDIRSVLACR